MKIRQPFSEVAYQAKKKEFLQIAKRDSLTETQRIDLLIETHWKRIWSFCFSSKQEAKTKLSLVTLRPLLPYYKKALETTERRISYAQLQQKRETLEKNKQTEKEERALMRLRTFEDVFPVACFLEKQDASLQETTEASLYQALLIERYFSKALSSNFQELSPTFLWQMFQLIYLTCRQIQQSPKRTPLRETYQKLAVQLLQQTDGSKQEFIEAFFQQGAKDLPTNVVQLALQNMEKFDTSSKMQRWKALLLQGPIISALPNYQESIHEHGLNLEFLNQQIQQVKQTGQEDLVKTLSEYEAVYPLALKLGRQASNLTEPHYQRALLLEKFYGTISLSDPEQYWQGFQHAFYANDIGAEVYAQAKKQNQNTRKSQREERQAQIRKDSQYPTMEDKLRAYLTELYPVYFQTDFQSAEELIQRMEKHIPHAQHLVKKLGVPSASHTRTFEQLKQRLHKVEQLADNHPHKNVEYEKAMSDLVAFPIAQKLTQKEVQLRHLKEAKILMELYGTENALSYSQPREKLTLVLEILRFQRTLSCSTVTKKQLTGLKQAQKNYHYIPNTAKKV